MNDVRGGGPGIAYAAAAWALAFAVLHVAWAAGWYVLLPTAEAEAAFSRRWFWNYNAAVAAACAVGAAVALGLVQPWGRRVPRRLLAALAWTGFGLLAVRAGGSAVQVGHLLAVGAYAPRAMHLYELWFYLGAFLFGATLWRHGRAPAGRRGVRA